MTEKEDALLELGDLRQKAREHHATQWHTVKLDLQTITPVYGGGTTAGEPDMLLPFRPRAIKNSLRHWWWLLNRRKPEYKTDSQALFADMTAIWGGASNKEGDSKRSKVRVKVVTSPLTGANCIRSVEYENSLGYILWMTLQAEFAGKGQMLIKPGYSFSLQIDIHDSLKPKLPQIVNAINAWIHLGGVGARTTRGLGKLQVNSSASSPLISISEYFSETDDWFEGIKDAFPQGSRLRRDKEFSNALQALGYSVQAFKTFRQARQFGQLPNGKRMRINRSYWPKADVIRFVTRKFLREHQPHPNINSIRQPVPELFFGAPIVYKFKDKRDPDPGTLTFAYPKKPLERFTSPLLLTVVRSGKSQYVPAVFVLASWADLSDKQVYLDQPNKYIEAGVWWPDVNKDDAVAKEFLSDLTMHEEKFCDATGDELREYLKWSRSKLANPLVSFLKFFSAWEEAKHK